MGVVRLAWIRVGVAQTLAYLFELIGKVDGCAVYPSALGRAYAGRLRTTMMQQLKHALQLA